MKYRSHSTQKVTNALRRLYQRTKNNDEIRGMRKKQYLESKATDSATIKREKTRSWKEYCNMTTATNPWTMVYKLAAGKRNASTITTTLQNLIELSLTAQKKLCA